MDVRGGFAATDQVFGFGRNIAITLQKNDTVPAGMVWVPLVADGVSGMAGPRVTARAATAEEHDRYHDHPEQALDHPSIVLRERQARAGAKVAYSALP